MELLIFAVDMHCSLLFVKQAVLHLFCAVDLIAVCSSLSVLLTQPCNYSHRGHASPQTCLDLRGSAELFYINVMDQTRSTAVQHNRALHNEKGGRTPPCLYFKFTGSL